MKKIIIILGFIISFTLIGLGVYGLVLDMDRGNVSNNNSINKLDVLKNSIETLKGINNFTYGVEVTTNKEEENATSLIKMDLSTNQSEISMVIANAVVMHSYTVLEEGLLVNYLSMPLFGSDNYSKTIETEGSSSINFNSTRYDVLLNNISLFEDRGNNIFMGIFPKEIASALDINSNDENQQLEIVGDVIILITLNADNGVDNILYNFSNSIKGEEEIYTNYVMVETYSNIGNTEIVVPDEVKNSAIES